MVSVGVQRRTPSLNYPAALDELEVVHVCVNTRTDEVRCSHITG